MGSAAYAITDLALGAVTVVCAALLQRVAEVARAWRLTFWFAGASAFAGAGHHGLFHAGWSWTVVGVLVVVAISYLLIASARQILRPRAVRVVIVIRAAGVAAYGVAILFGESGLEVLLAAESLTMATILALWLYALRTGHPMARPVIVAILAHGLAGVAFVLPAAVTAPTGLDSTSLSHLAQIPGVLLLYRAVVAGIRPRGPGDRRAPSP